MSGIEIGITVYQFLKNPIAGEKMKQALDIFKTVAMYESHQFSDKFLNTIEKKQKTLSDDLNVRYHDKQLIYEDLVEYLQSIGYVDDQNNVNAGGIELVVIRYIPLNGKK